MTARAIILRPIQRWPGVLLDDSDRAGSPFRATWSDTKALLLDEAAKIGAAEVVVQLGIDEADLRNDGQLRAHTKAKHPGVIVSVDSNSGPLSFPCDAFVARYYGQEDWHANVRAVALAMRSLRQLDRYGITEHAEQYVGWKAIGSGSGETSVDAAARLIAQAARMDDGARNSPVVERIIADPDYRQQMYYVAAKNTHPDHGGSDEAFRNVRMALEVLAENAP